MEATFKISAEEFDSEFFEKIKSFIIQTADAYVTVSVKEREPYYSDKLLHSKEELESKKNLITFTMEELQEYTANVSKNV